MQYFETIFLEEAEQFLSGIDRKAAAKIIYNIDRAAQTNDPKLFKKLRAEIWEFRTRFAGKQYRLLAFWDKSGGMQTLVIATHGFVKKVDKVPAREIERAEGLCDMYYEGKLKK